MAIFILPVVALTTLLLGEAPLLIVARPIISITLGDSPGVVTYGQSPDGSTQFVSSSGPGYMQSQASSSGVPGGGHQMSSSSSTNGNGNAFNNLMAYGINSLSYGQQPGLDMGSQASINTGGHSLFQPMQPMQPMRWWPSLFDQHGQSSSTFQWWPSIFGRR